MDDQNDGRRLCELDAIRGIAACIVVLDHFYLVLSPETFPAWIQWGMQRTPLHLFISGTESVMLFFILSGFVLSLPFHRSPGRLGYRSFLAKRIARIYLPYLAALFLAVLGNIWYHGLAINSYFIQTWSGPVELRTLWQHVLFLGNYNCWAFNTAFWSLVYEMRISIIFPILCLGVIRIGLARSILLAAGVAVLSVILRSAGINSGTTDTLKFVSFFIVGILLAQFTPNIRKLLSRIPIPLRLAGLLLSLLFYSLGHLFPNAAKDPMIIIGASGIIAAGLCEPEISKMLRLSLFQYLGRISYSIYLLHGTILYLLVYTLYDRVPLIWLFLPLAIGVLFFSTAFYYLVEKPSIRLGHKLAKGFRSAADFSGKAVPEVTAVPGQPPGKTVLAVPNQDG